MYAAKAQNENISSFSYYSQYYYCESNDHLEKTRKYLTFKKNNPYDIKFECMLNPTSLKKPFVKEKDGRTYHFTEMRQKIPKQSVMQVQQTLIKTQDNSEDHAPQFPCAKFKSDINDKYIYNVNFRSYCLRKFKRNNLKLDSENEPLSELIKLFHLSDDFENDKNNM